jgi:N-acetylmuramoyl-L-alanine amidase
MQARAVLLIFLLFCVPLVLTAAERPAVTAVRAAEHDGITRVVLELSGPVTFEQLPGDGDARRLGVSLPELNWRADKLRAIGLVNRLSYAAAEGRLLVETNRPAVIRKLFLIPPSGGNDYRLVLDLEPTSGGVQSPIAAGTLSPPLPKPPASAVPVVVTKPAVPAVMTKPAVPAVMTKPAAAEPDHKERHAGKPIVVIDPGHGGVDPGATSITGAYEKNIVLALAHDIKEELDKGGKVNCQLTRDRDIFIPLRERVAIARTANADLFMSLHADSLSDPDIHGLSVYTLSQNASDAEAQALADKENKADIVAGIDLSNESPEVTNILIDLVQRESMNLSAGFAQRLIGEVAKDTHQLLQNTHRFAGFAVLKAPDIPSVLVESGYISNQRDEEMLRRPEYRAKLAAALARAIEGFLVRPQTMRHS